MQLSSFFSKMIALEIFLVTYRTSDSRIDTNETLLDVGTLLITNIVISHKFSLSILHLALHVTWLFLETLNKLHGLLPFVICLLSDSYSINRYIAQNLHCCRTKREKKWVSTQWFINMVHSSDSLWTQNWINFSKKLQSLSIFCNLSTFFGLVYTYGHFYRKNIGTVIKLLLHFMTSDLFQLSLI